MARTAIQNANASLYMDGNAGYFTIPITPSPTGFSFGLWIKTGKRTAASTSIYMSSTSASFTDGFILARGNGRGDIEFSPYNTTTLLGTVRTGQISDNAWAHVVVTYLPSGACSIYLNGVLSQTTTATGTMTTGTTSVFVGRRSHAAAFAGLNANNLVWHNTTTPWTQEQVTALYQNGTIPTGATAVYPLSEGAGSIAYDTSGNGNDGTITSGTWTRDTPTKTRKAVGGNLVYNGDFEIAPVVNVAQTTAYKWYDGTVGGNGSNTPSVNTNRTSGIYYWDEGGQGSIMIDTTEQFRGKNSLKVSTLATGSYAAASLGDFNVDDYIPVLPSTSYTYSVWIKTNYVSGVATSGAFFSLVELNGARTTGLNTDTTRVKTTQDWTQYTGTFTTAASARFVRAMMRVIGNDGTGTLIMDAWFADITLTKTTPEARTVAGTRTVVTSRSVA
jgi:hypothetical protein